MLIWGHAAFASSVFPALVDLLVCFHADVQPMAPVFGLTDLNELTATPIDTCI
jgi:hypothetical protein